MLYFTLAASAVLLVVENLAARFRPKYVVLASAVGFIGTGAMSIGFVPLPLLLHTALLSVLGGVWQWRKGFGKNRYLALSAIATVVAYAAFIPAYLSHLEKVARDRERFPFESMDGRVPPPPNTSSGPPAYDTARATELETSIAREAAYVFNRSHQLQNLHENTVQHFVESEGFGVGRLVMMADSEFRYDEVRFGQPAPTQPSGPTYAVSGRTQTWAADRDALGALHAGGVLDFVHPVGFGYVKDRQHVAGFRSHRFSQVPWTPEWEVTRLELVSLLRHSEPAVYMSERLPQMDALAGVPLRPLNEAEEEGLPALRNGQELWVKGDRMLGAVRSVKQCIACHGGERGQLLGAFSYTIRPARK